MIGNYYLLKLFISLLLFLSYLQPAIAAQKRVALVIGNSSYIISPLKNPVNDANDMTAKLKNYGFEVEKLTDANKRQMRKAVDRFSRRLNQKDTVGLFFFAGHGIQVNNYNYLLPIGSDINNEADVEYEAINASRILDLMAMSDNGLNLMILDACRNNPFSRSFRSSSRGLTLMRPASGTMIFYATEPGKIAADGQGRNGLFTEKLLSNMDKKGLKVEDIFKQTAIQVKQSSNKKQVPWSEGIIFGNFYFNGDVTVKQPKIEFVESEAISTMDRRENIFWNSIDKLPSIGGYTTYLQQYPNGHYVPVARYKIKQLSKKPATHKTIPKTIPTEARLTIRSNVYGDSVKINGEDKGSTKLDLQLKPGFYELEVSKSGYKTWSRSLQITSGNDQLVYAKLLKIPKSKPIKIYKKEKSYKTLLSENFSTNKNAWAEVSKKEVEIKNKNGKYYFRHKRDKFSWFSHKPIKKFNTYKDFKIEVIAKHISGIENNGFGISWGNNGKNIYAFQISANGYFVFNKEVNGKVKSISGWLKSEYIHKLNRANRLSVEREGERLKFYINDKKVYEAAFESFTGNRIGFRVDHNQAVEFDNLLVQIRE